MNKSFLILLVLVIFLGAGFGGSFVGGVIYGQSLEDETDSSLSPRLGSSQVSGGFSAEGGGQRGGQGRRGQVPPTGAGQEETTDTAAVAPAAERQPRQGREVQRGANSAADSGAGRDAGGDQPTAQTSSLPEGEASREAPGPTGEPGQAPSPGGSGRGGFEGTIARVEGDLITVTSSRGDLAVNIAGSTMVYEVKEATPEALTTGARVRIAGSRNEEGEIAAQSVVIMPEGADNLFGSAAGPGGRRRGQ